MNNIIDVYTDGSCNRGEVSAWAFIALENNKEIDRKTGILRGEICSTWNIGAELTAVQEAVRWAKERNYKINIYYDLEGAKLWADGSWRCKNKWTAAYCKFMDENKDVVYSWTKVRGHSGNEWNEMVDKLVGNTLNVARLENQS